MYKGKPFFFPPLSTVLLKYYFFCRSGCFPHLFIIACCYRTLQNWNQAIQILFYLRRVLLIHAMYSSGLIRQISKGLELFIANPNQAGVQHNICVWGMGRRYLGTNSGPVELCGGSAIWLQQSKSFTICVKEIFHWDFSECWGMCFYLPFHFWMFVYLTCPSK